MSIAYLQIPHFSLRVALLERPELDGMPLALSAPSNSRPLVQDCTPEAAKQGTAQGMPSCEATAVGPEAIFISSNPVRDAVFADSLLDAQETFSPLIEPDVPGRLYIDLRGLARH